jgi:hypothetical protein
MRLCLTEARASKTGPPRERSPARLSRACAIADVDPRPRASRRPAPEPVVLKRCPVAPIIETVQWKIYVCRSCGDYGLGGWEELLHLPNQRCPGIKDPGGHVFRVLVTDRHEHGRGRLRSAARRGRCH